jgi:hypothetical protein
VKIIGTVLNETSWLMSVAYTPTSASYHFGISIEKAKEILLPLPKVETSLLGMWRRKEDVEAAIKRAKE